MKEERYDVVVVGAGPAGSVTARTAASQGLDVLLIDRKQEIGVPVCCAEGVSNAVERYIQPDRRWICAEVKGANIYSPDGTKVTLSGSKMEEVGYVLDRKEFDKALATEAASAGAEVRVKTEAYGIITDGNHKKGVYVRGMDGNTRIYADIIVGADGVESKIGRWAGINTHLKPSELCICAEYLMCNIEIEEAFSEFFLGEKVAPRGYAWVFPKGENCANVGLGIGGDVSKDKHRAMDYLRAFVHDKFPAGEVMAEIYGAVPLSGPLHKSVSDGLVLVGDAARHVNPLTGGGILYAMQAAEIAGDVIAKAIHEGDTSEDRLKEYDNRCRSEFGKRLETALKAKEFFFRLSDDDLNTLAHSLEGVNLKELSTRALVLELIKRNPRRLVDLAKIVL